MFKTFRASRVSTVFCLTFAFLFSAILIHAQRPQGEAAPAPKESDLFKALQWRSIGPYRGGRSDAVAGVASQPLVFYYGATGGGVWQTTDGGISCVPVTDGSVFGTGAMGA